MKKVVPAIIITPGLASVLILFLTGYPKAQEKTSSTAKAVSIISKEFLQVPDGVSRQGYLVAKTPPKVDFVIIPGLENKQKGTLWSSWGDGCFHSNGKYYTSVGDHLGIDGNSYVYEYDPATQIIRRVVDVLRVIGHILGLYGHGKIHSGIHEAADGTLYFSTYWGKHRQIDKAFERGKYNGSIVLNYNPKTGKTENLGPIVPMQGLPASTFDPKNQLLYFHAVYKGNIAVFDTKSGKVRFLGGEERTDGKRAFLLSKDGKVYFSAKGGTLDYYDPTTNQLGQTNAQLPKSPGSRKGNSLRAASTFDKDGILYGMTASGRMFSFDPMNEKIKDLGPNFLDGDYTAVMVLSPDGKYLYYAPGAHGSGNRVGVPVIQYHIASGKRKVLAFLRDPLRKRYKYNLGGTYNLQIDPAGERLFITFNGSDLGARNPFGKPSMVVVHIPKSERG